MVVQGETFRVQERPDEPGVYEFVWESGPNPGYGFTSGARGASGAPVSVLADAIRNFLAQIDPRTGYIGDQ
jgi:hypothetical protein